VSGFDQIAIDNVCESKTALDEFLTADILVLGVPFYNSVPSSLKAIISALLVMSNRFAPEKYGR